MSQIKDSPITWTTPMSTPLVRVRAGRAQCVCVTGRQISWFVHWSPADKRTLPCLQFNCPLCKNAIPRRPLSYFSVMHWRMVGGAFAWSKAVLELPLNAGFTVAQLIGRVIQLRRDRAFGPVLIGTYDSEPQAPAAEPFDVLPVLLGLWRLPVNSALALVGANEVDHVGDVQYDD